MSSFLTIAIECALAAIITRIIYLCYFHPLARYPGPFVARFTNLWRFLTFLRGHHHLEEQRLHERHGPVVRVAPNWLSFSNLDDFETIYGFNKSIEKGKFYDFGRDRNERAESVFSAKSDASHRQKLRKLHPALSSAKISDYEPIVTKHVSGLVSCIESNSPQQDKGDANVVNIVNLIHRYTVDTVLEVIYGPCISPQPYTTLATANGIDLTLRVMTKMAWSYSLLPWFGWLMNTRPVNALIRKPTHNEEGALTGISALVAATRLLIFKTPQKVMQVQQPGIVKTLLEVPSDDSNRMTDDEVWAESFNLVLAGPGSSAAALTALLFMLGSKEGRPWQDRLRMEAKAAGEGSLSASLPPVLNAIIKETIRFLSPFPTGFPRTIAPGAENAMNTLPAPLPVGTLVSANTYILGRSKAIWGDDADQWLPQRWLGDENERREMENKLVAFNKGSRVCAGKDLALVMIGKAATEIVQRWDMESVGELQVRGFLEMQYESCWIKFRDPTELDWSGVESLQISSGG